MEKIVNNTTYKIVDKNNGVFKVKAIVGGNGVNVIFSCLDTEWDYDFVIVQERLKEIITNCAYSI